MGAATHAVRNSLIDRERVFRLEADALAWTDGKRESRMAYRDITEIHLISYAGVGGAQFQCAVRDRSGKRVKLRSHHYQRLAVFEDRSASYGPFVSALVENLGREGHGVKFHYGSNVMRAVWMVLLVLSLLVLTGYMFALIGGVSPTVGSIAPMTVLALLVPFSWAMIGRSKPGTFDPKSPPAGLLGR